MMFINRNNTMSISRFLAELIRQITRFVDAFAGRHTTITFEGVYIMQRIKDDAPDATYSVTQPTGAHDAEGFPLPEVPRLNYTFESDNPTAVSVTPNDDGTWNRHIEGPKPDGSDNIANITVRATGDDGTDYGIVTGEQLVVTTGEIAGFDGIELKVDGQTPA
jgi:hypothetical protein